MTIAPGEAPPETGLEFIQSSEIRQNDWPELPTPIPGLLEGFLTILAGAGGVGKTFLAEQIARHMGSGVPLGRFPMPDQLAYVWALFLEDVEALTQARSLDVAPLGTLAEDQHAPASGHDTIRYITSARHGTASLRAALEKARAEGQFIPSLIIIDYLHLFIGSQPSGANPVDWERSKIIALRDLAAEFDTHIVVLTHMNKAGAVNGTASLLNVCDTMYVVELKDDRNFAALVCKKMRVAPMTDYAICRKSNGTWGFDDENYVSEAMADGLARGILTVLRREGPRTLSQLCMHPAIGGQRAGIRAALSRSRKKGWITPYAGHWQIVQTPGDAMLRPAPTPVTPCPVCGLEIRAPHLAEDGMHPMCAPESAPVAAAEAIAEATEVAKEAAAAAAEEKGTSWGGLARLKRSVQSSRYHPIAAILKEERTEAPWTLVTEVMGGEPSWCRIGQHSRKERKAGKPRFYIRPDDDVPAGGFLVTIDRNGSYPSACSSVPLAPNMLKHTGPLENPDGRGGIFQIEEVPWNLADGPHPLGRIARESGPQWVTTPHVRLLSQIGMRPVILDSYTGKVNESLFERFYRDARTSRAELLLSGDMEAYNEYKASMSSAVRLLWPKYTKSPFWRPDWRTSLQAEAAVRHWLRAREAQSRGARLLGLLNVDEAVFWTPDGEVPAPYVVGDRFGQVKIKEVQPL